MASAAPAVATPVEAPRRSLWLRRWWASVTYATERPVPKVAVLALAGTVSGFAEAAVVVLIIALVSAGQSERLPFADALPASPWAIAGLALLACLGLAASHATSAIVAARAGAQVQRTVQTRLLDGFLGAPWSAQARLRVGELQELATVKVNLLARGVQEGAASLASVANLVVVIVAAAFLSAWATAGLLVSVAIVLAASRPVRARRRKAMTGWVASSSTFAADLTETAGAARDLRVFGVTAAARDRLAQRVDDLARRTVSMRTAMAATPPLTRDATVAVLVVGLAVVVTGSDVALPTLGASMILVMRGLAHMQALSTAAMRLQEREANLALVDGRLSQWRVPSSRGARRHAGLRRVELRDATLTHAGADRPALVDVSLTIERGEQVGLVGPTGAGKSTLASVLVGLLEPDAGRVLVDGADLAELDPDDWHAQTAWVGQDPQLLTGTVGENVRFHRSGVSDEAVHAAAVEAGLATELELWPDGLDHPVGVAGASLSGGQRQRVALARALAGRPGLVVLDEPTSALDPFAEAAVRGALENLRATAAVLVIAHRLSTLQACDRVAVMDAGRIVRLAPPAELALDDPWYRRALELSAR